MNISGFFYDPRTGLEDGVLRDLAADAAGGVHVAVPADDGAGVQHAVAAHLHIITQHGADLLAVGGQLPLPVLQDHQRLVGLYVAGDGAGAHMGLVQ